MDGVRVVVDTSWLDKLGPLSDEMIGKICTGVAKDARRLVPVLTGDLRSSIHVLGVHDGVGRVGAGGGQVDYALHVEHGTSRAPAQPYLKPALYRARELS